jgi:hypothetical protein
VKGKRVATPRPETLSTLLGLAPSLPGPWHTSSANITMEPVVVLAADVEWLVHVHAYAVRNHLTKPSEVKVTVGATIQTQQVPGNRSVRARVSAWQRGIAKRFADLGYEGAWGRSPNGPFAHFRKDVSGVRAVPAAIRQLQRIRF